MLEEVRIKKTKEKLSLIELDFSKYSKVKNILCGDSTITFTLPDKTEISERFRYSKKLSSYSNEVFVSEQGNVILYLFTGQAGSFGFGSERKMALVVGDNVYRLSSKQLSQVAMCKWANALHY